MQNLLDEKKTLLRDPLASLVTQKKSFFKLTFQGVWPSFGPEKNKPATLPQVC